MHCLTYLHTYTRQAYIHSLICARTHLYEQTNIQAYSHIHPCVCKRTPFVHIRSNTHTHTHTQPCKHTRAYTLAYLHRKQRVDWWKRVETRFATYIRERKDTLGEKDARRDNDSTQQRGELTNDQTFDRINELVAKPGRAQRRHRLAEFMKRQNNFRIRPCTEERSTVE
jgi:hypothetical protein